MQFSIRQLMLFVTLFAVILGQATFVIRARRERDELRVQLGEERLRAEHHRFDAIRAKAGWEISRKQWDAKLKARTEAGHNLMTHDRGVGGV